MRFSLVKLEGKMSSPGASRHGGFFVGSEEPQGGRLRSSSATTMERRISCLFHEV